MVIKEIKKLDDGTPYVIEVRSENNDMRVNMKWDGCIDITTYSNGSTPENYLENDTCYIHICEVKEFIKQLQSVVDISEQNFNESDFKNYWE